MYRWLRRLIRLNKDYVMNQTQFEVELVLQDAAERPTQASYSECHKFAGQTFSPAALTCSNFSQFIEPP
jgi:hypothetical protein